MDTLEKEACINNEETQKRLIEDKELQSHIECLYSQLEEKCDALKDIEMKYKAATEENESPIVPLRYSCVLFFIIIFAIVQVDIWILVISLDRTNSWRVFVDENFRVEILYIY